jgi:hypothetical protein
MTADDGMRLFGIIQQLAIPRDTILCRAYLRNDVELYRWVEFIAFQLCQAKAGAFKMVVEGENIASF